MKARLATTTLAAISFGYAGFLAPAAAAQESAVVAEPEVDELPKRYPPSSVRPKLVAGGLALTGLAYGAAALSGSNWDDVPGADALLVPVVGPWIALGQNDCAPDDPDCGFILYFRGFLTILDGIIQAGGLAIAGEGMFMTTEADQPAAAETGIQWHPVPLVSPNQTGLGISGSF